jgi:hypothetical protein
MVLLDLWRDAAIEDGFEKGRSLNEISEETGLSVREVVERITELRLIPGGVAARILDTPPPNPQSLPTDRL